MDEETVIESIIEVANKGSYSFLALEQLNSELNRYGYTDTEIQSLIKLACMGSKANNKRKYAIGMFGIISNKSTTRIHLNEISDIYTLCLLNL